MIKIQQRYTHTFKKNRNADLVFAKNFRILYAASSALMPTLLLIERLDNLAKFFDSINDYVVTLYQMSYYVCVPPNLIFKLCAVLATHFRSTVCSNFAPSIKIQIERCH